MKKRNQKFHSERMTFMSQKSQICMMMTQIYIYVKLSFQIRGDRFKL